MSGCCDETVGQKHLVEGLLERLAGLGREGASPDRAQ